MFLIRYVTSQNSMKLVVTANINCDFNTYVEACQQPGAGFTSLVQGESIYRRTDAHKINIPTICSNTARRVLSIHRWHGVSGSRGTDVSFDRVQIKTHIPHGTGVSTATSLSLQATIPPRCSMEGQGSGHHSPSRRSRPSGAPPGQHHPASRCISARTRSRSSAYPS